ncbi:hypothetical protein [Ochrobactrum sp. Marseille-Q0166]|uniref:hypothetical protein n=1 Tax=Ochrobactrum sp. Marseille-Q0166 TaxID=2761105 RepID=UPI001655DE04|nr:hypothetical protein [Ochrobactrum sp. Marseille-Q0166]MBC8718811.1 hypothetical protein [Ochrobactrum sp. Marseille-Q0166]
MLRRTFLRMLSLAPVAAAVPAMALPRPENVRETVKGSVTMGDRAWSQSEMFLDASQAGPSKIVIDYDALNRDLEGVLRWINESTRNLVADGMKVRG